MVSARHRLLGGCILGIVLAGGHAGVAAAGVQAPVGRESSPGARARALKAAGDDYAAGDRLDRAAETYLEALSVSRDAFTPDERVEMAIYISWEDHLEDAANELRMVLSEHPEHIGARTHLARVYAWDGRLSDSLRETQKVLAVAPGDRDALLVKADALEWQGHFSRAIPVYEEILESSSDFDAGLGLSWALLSGGDRSAARERAARLSPVTARQTAQLDELSETIDDASRPRVDMRHNYYEDSDGNQHHRYSLSYGFGLGNSDFQLDLTRTDSRDAIRTSRSRSAELGVDSVLAEGFSIGAGVGVTQPGVVSQPNLASGRFELTHSLSNGSIAGSVSSAVLVDTTELIENRIRVESYEATVSKPISDRVTVSGAYGLRDFSDGNRAHGVRFSPEFLALAAPRVTLGYQFRFDDYRGQTGSGYFDPQAYVAHRAFSSLYYESPRFYTWVNGFVGRQQYRRNGNATADVVLGGGMSVGFTPVRAVSIEINAEGGNFAAGTVSGFTYFDLGSRVRIAF